MTTRSLVALALTVLLATSASANPELDAIGVGKDVQALAVGMVAGDDKDARKRLERLARDGRTDAAEALGEILSLGTGQIKADRKAACRWFEIAARDRGDGRHNLALCFETGHGGEQDLTKAVRLYGEAGDMGYAQSYCAKGNLLIAGKGAPKDVPQGVALCLKGAEGGSADAQTDVGNFYLRGQGVPQDYAKAAYWYEKAAAQKQANAAFVLGQMHWNGDGVKKDHARAAELWRIAYQGGRLDAPFYLGREALNRAFADKSGAVDEAALEDAIGWMELAEKSDPDPEHRALMAKGLPIMRARLELARRAKRS